MVLLYTRERSFAHEINLKSYKIQQFSSGYLHRRLYYDGTRTHLLLYTLYYVLYNNMSCKLHISLRISGN